jgi:hypothetical protein
VSAEDAVDIPLLNIRQQALRCLSELLAIRPEYYARPCPELRINGSGNIVEMTRRSSNTLISPQPSSPARTSIFVEDHKLCDDYRVPRFSTRKAGKLFTIDRVSTFQDYDGTLQNHIAYHRSVLKYVDGSDQYARACKCSICRCL